jgi:hypothetical protein
VQLDSSAESAPDLPETQGPSCRSFCLDLQGAIQTLAGVVIALIALLTSYDHISLPAGAALQLPQQWGVWFIAASMALVVVDAQLATGSRRRERDRAVRAAQDAARAADETTQERNRAAEERIRADRERNRAAEERERASRSDRVQARALRAGMAFMGIMSVNEASNIIFNDYFKRQFMYESCISSYSSLFGDENICIIYYEDMVANPSAALDHIQGFLRLDKINLELPIKNSTLNKKLLPRRFAVALHKLSLYTGLYPFIPAEIRNWIRELFSSKSNLSRLYETLSLKDSEKQALADILKEDRINRGKNFGVIDVYCEAMEGRAGMFLN